MELGISGNVWKFSLLWWKHFSFILNTIGHRRYSTLKTGLDRKSDLGKSEKIAVKFTTPKIAKRPPQRAFKNRTPIFFSERKSSFLQFPALTELFEKEL